MSREKDIKLLKHQNNNSNSDGWEPCGFENKTSMKQMVHSRQSSGLLGSVIMRRMAQNKPSNTAAANTEQVHNAASDGIKGNTQTLPYLDKIQASFGTHDVSKVEAHVGGPATQACEKMGAEAYATGNHVAFGASPSLHTAAHEAAHVVQQRAGVSLEGGVGEVGDVYERHADEVADRVVQGKSVEGLLGTHAGGIGSAAVQKRAQHGQVQLISCGGDKEYVQRKEAGSSKGDPMCYEPSTDPSNEVEQDPNAPISVAPEGSLVCVSLSEESVQVIHDFLAVAHSELARWVSWRSGEGWDEGAGSNIPNLQALSAATRELSSHAFTCNGESDEGVSADDGLVRDALSKGADGQRGLSDEDIQYVSEWMSYDGGRLPALSKYFCVEPVNIIHNYGINIILGTDAGVGASPAGAKIDIPFFEVAAGCYLVLNGKVQLLEFSYHNNLGLSWSAEYASTTVEIGVECGATVVVGPTISSSFGSKKFCSGSAEETNTWYGPEDFTGGNAEVDVGVNGGVILDASASGSTVLIEPTNGKPSLLFNTSGACLGLSLGGGSKGSLTSGAGGQIDISDPTVTSDEVNNVEGVRENETGYGTCEKTPTTGPVTPYGTRTLITRYLYFDTGSSKTDEGKHVTLNQSAIRDIVETLESAGADFQPDEVEFVITGHASPLWVGADSEHEAADENQVLAGARANMASEVVRAAYDQFIASGTGWPEATVLLNTICTENTSTASEITTHNMGSSEGFAETGDLQNNDAKYRRATLVVNVTHYEQERLNTIP